MKHLKKNDNYLSGILFAAFLVTIILCLRIFWQNTNSTTQQSSTLVSTERITHSDKLSYQSVIQAPVQSAINCPVSGTIQEVYVSYGQKVYNDTPLAVLASPDSKKQFNANLIHYLKNKDQLNLIKEKDKQNAELYADGIIPFDERKSASNQLNAQIIEFIQSENTIKDYCRYFDIPFTQVQSLTFANTQAVQELLEKPAKIVVKSTTEGILLLPNNQEKKHDKSTLTPGSKVEAEHILAIVGKPGLLKIDLSVPETDIHRIKIGQKVEIRPVAHRANIVQGEVKIVDRYNLSPGTREDIAYFPVLIEATCPENNCPLQSGMTAEVDIIVDELTGIRVPSTAINYENDKNFVIIENVEKKQKKLPVHVISTDAKSILIDANTAEGESIVRDYKLP